MPITPLSLGNSHLRLNIPIYQRLFVWGEEQINQLLKDLYESFLTNREQPYYIGIINILEKEQEQVIVWDIIDGQQRLTFLSLFGAYAISKTNNKQWNNF